MSRVRSYALLEFDSASLTASYQDFGSETSDEVVAFTIYNNSSVHCYISTDGSTNEIRIPNGGSFSYTASSANKEQFAFGKGTQLSIKQVTAAGTGPIVANLILEN